MRYVIEQFWVWAAVSAVLGLVVGWLSAAPERGGLQ